MGGATLYISQYIKYFVTNKYKVIVICRKKDQGSDFLQSLGAKTVFVHFPFAINFSALDKYNDTFKKRVIDIFKFIVGGFFSFFLILSYNCKYIIAGEFIQIPVLISSILLKKEIICLVQTSISRNNLKRKILFKLLKHVRFIIGITELHTRELRFRENIFTVPNAVLKSNTVKTVANIKDLLNLRNETVFVFFGGISQIKGTIHFIKIAIELLKLEKDICFIILGQFHKNFKTRYAAGTNSSDLKLNEEIFNLIGNDIDSKFKFLGEINYVNDLLKLSCYLVSTNIYPHFSKPIIEAWSNMIPVIAYKDNFTQHMSCNSKSILFLEKGEYKKSALIIKQLIEDHSLQKELIQNGYSNYTSYYTLEASDQKLNAIFRN